MQSQSTRAAAPSDDRRWRVVEVTMRRQGFAPSALIETLHAVQQSFGYLDEAALRYVASNLGLPPSRVYGVATFYHHFTLKPQGKHTCVLCTGTACYIKGSAGVLAAVERMFSLKEGATTADGELSLLTARCVGSCGLAPVAVLDGQVVGTVEASNLLERLRSLTGHDG